MRPVRTDLHRRPSLIQLVALLGHERGEPRAVGKIILGERERPDHNY